MARFYGTKILRGEINQKTGEAWKLEDVPTRWREATADWMDQQKGE